MAGPARRLAQFPPRGAGPGARGDDHRRRRQFRVGTRGEPAGRRPRHPGGRHRGAHHDDDADRRTDRLAGRQGRRLEERRRSRHGDGAGPRSAAGEPQGGGRPVAPLRRGGPSNLPCRSRLPSGPEPWSTGTSSNAWISTSAPTFTIGEASLTVSALLAGEPDRASASFPLGPRVILSLAALEETQVAGPGSLVRHLTRLRLDGATAVADVVAGLETAFPDARWRVRSHEDANPQLRRFLERLSMFITLVGLTALLVGGIGIFSAVSTYLERQVPTIAILKSLGAGARLVFAIYLAETAVMACLGVGIGLVAGRPHSSRGRGPGGRRAARARQGRGPSRPAGPVGRLRTPCRVSLRLAGACPDPRGPPGGAVARRQPGQGKNAPARRDRGGAARRAGGGPGHPDDRGTPVRGHVRGRLVCRLPALPPCRPGFSCALRGTPDGRACWPCAWLSPISIVRARRRCP